MNRTAARSEPALERRTREIGEAIFERARHAEPSIVQPDWWMGRLLDWSTADAQRKLQLFRFIDVLPSLSSDEQVADHLADYLLKDGVPLPRPFRHMLQGAADGAWYRGQLAAITRASAIRMARRFIAGENAREALETVSELRRRHMGFTLDLLGEAVTSNTQADAYAQGCMEMLRGIAPSVQAWPADEQVDGGGAARGTGILPVDRSSGTLPEGHSLEGRATRGSGILAVNALPGKPCRVPRLNLSLKLSSLDPNFDAIDPPRTSAVVLGRLRPILRLAGELGGYIHVDMEQYDYKDLTLEIFRTVLMDPEFRDWPDIGIVLQAYLRDAEQDLERVLGWVRERGTPITIRLVKGAYWDYETFTAIQQNWRIPVWTQKWESDASFERMARRLLDERGLARPALGSHNVRSLAASMAYAESIGVTPREYEVQMLFGMGDPLKTAVVDLGYTLRVYTPFGQLIPGMAYLIRRLLENTSNESFLKQSVSESESIDELLADPVQARPPSPPIPEPVVLDPDEDSPMTPFATEPHTDFARPRARESMHEALGQVRSRFGRLHPLVIAGNAVETTDVIESKNPSAFKEVVGRVCLASREHVDWAVQSARTAFESWSWLPARERGDYLRRAAQIMRDRRFELAAWTIHETGKPWREADGDIAEAIDFCEFYSREMQRLENRPRRRDFPGEENTYAYQPRGVAAVIAPWNFPLAILTGMSTAALAAGNTVIMKPAEQSSVVAAKLMEIFQEAQFPPGVVHYLPGRGEEVGAALVSHPGVNLIAFTGSREVGIAIYAQAAQWQPGQQSLKRVIAEMGGKNAIIVDADADLDEAVAGVVTSIFGYAGQKCSACSRVIVLESIQDAFVQRLIDTTRSIQVGPADDPGTLVGPVIDATSRDRVLRYIEAGRREGKLVFQAVIGDLPDRGYFVPPTIFHGVPPEATIAQEEIFGPVVAVLAARDFQQALEIANGTEYALTGGLFSRNLSHVELARRRFNVGNLYINRGITGALVDRQPFGGFKMSGVGSKAGGPDYLLQFLEPKTITENTLRHGFAPESTAPARDRP